MESIPKLASTQAQECLSVWVIRVVAISGRLPIYTKVERASYRDGYVYYAEKQKTGYEWCGKSVIIESFPAAECRSQGSRL